MLFLHLRATFFRFFEMCKVFFRYYPHRLFFLYDLLLHIQYFWKSPHRLSKAFLQKRGEKNVHAYGETPLTTLDFIARQCQILSKDIVYELGCGSGRTSLWLSHFIRCQVVGIDYQPHFIKKANRIKKWLGLSNVTFLLEDMCHVNLKKATVIYLYGICLEEKTIKTLIDSLLVLKPATKIITVSYPLTDYSTEFSVQKSFFASYPWGKAYTFLNIKN